MSVFDYLSVFFSVILGLAVTQVLLGFRGLMLARRRVKIYWPALIWDVLVIFVVAGAWWGMFAMRKFEVWTFAMYAAVVVQITLIYLVAGLTIPDIPAEGPVDMREMYYAHNGWFYTLFALVVAATFAKDMITTGHFSSVGNACFLSLFFVLALIGANTKRAWFHVGFAWTSVVVITIYTAVLSFRL